MLLFQSLAHATPCPTSIRTVQTARMRLPHPDMDTPDAPAVTTWLGTSRHAFTNSKSLGAR
jgi:hypothetical protein